MLCSSIVLPVRGGATIRPRWPLPMGVSRSITRPEKLSRDGFELQARVRIERRQVVEEDLVARFLGRLEVDGVDFDQREVALAFLGRPDLAGDGVAGAQIETADLRGRDVDVVGAGQIVVLGRAQEAEAVGQAFEHAFGEDQSALFGLRLQDLEDQLLLAQTGGAGTPISLATWLRFWMLMSLSSTRSSVGEPFLALCAAAACGAAGRGARRARWGRACCGDRLAARQAAARAAVGFDFGGSGFGGSTSAASLSAARLSEPGLAPRLSGSAFGAPSSARSRRRGGRLPWRAARRSSACGFSVARGGLFRPSSFWASSAGVFGLRRAVSRRAFRSAAGCFLRG